MGYVTRAELRRMVAQRLGFFGEGYPSSVTSTTLVDTNTPERRREQNDYWVGGTLSIVSGTGGPSNELLLESTLSETETNGGTVTASTTDPYDASCYALATSSTAGSVAIASFTAAVTAGRMIEISFRAKGDGTVCPRWCLYNATASADIIAAEPTYITGTRWTRFIRTVIVPSGCASVALKLYSASELSKTTYVDAPSIRQLGQQRYVDDWIADYLTFSVATWTTNPGTASRYEVYYKNFTIPDYNRAISDTLRAAYPFLYEMDEDESILTASGAESYAIPNSIAPDSIVKVEVETDTSDSTVPWMRHIFWRIRRVGKENTLEFTHMAPPDGRNIRLTFMRPLDSLESDFDTVDERYVPYVTLGAMARLYDMMLGKTSRSDRTQIGENRDAFFEEASYALKQVAMQLPATHVRPAYPSFH